MAVYEEIRIRRDSQLNWEASNPRLGLGELGIDMTQHRIKAGNGIDRWNELPYLNEDAYTLLNNLGQTLADTAQDIRHEVETNRLSAEQKIAELRNESRQSDNTLTNRIGNLENQQSNYESSLTARQANYESGLTTRQANYEGSLTSRQANYEADVSSLVSGMRSELDTGLEDFGRTKEDLTVRMDVIAGQTTEDTEILDARVDAENDTHPNLGHNIRSLHSLLHETESQTRENLNALGRHLQNQTDILSAEILRMEFARQDDNENINSAIEQEHSERQDEAETLDRLHGEREDFLQEQNDNNASAVLNLAYRLEQEQNDDILSWNEDLTGAVNAASRYGKNEQFSMLCMADVHRQSARVKAGIKYLNAVASIDCGCCLGDLQNNFTNPSSKYQTEYVDAVNTSRKPFYTVLGNHEMGGGASRVKGATCEAVFQKYMKPVIAKTGLTGITKGYYRADWEQYGISLIVLNGYCGPEDTDENGNFIYTNINPYFGQEQINWLINELGTIPAGNSLIIMLHMQDFRIFAEDNTFTDASRIGKTYGGSTHPYGTNGIIQDIIEAWRLGSKFEHEYIPTDSSGVTETISIKCDYTERGAGDFICWLTGHHHVDIIGRSVKYPAQLVVHVCSTAGVGYAGSADTPRTENTRAEDAITVFVADKISHEIRLVRIGSNVTQDMRERIMTSISWRYEDPVRELNPLELEAEIKRQAENLQGQTDELSEGLLNEITARVNDNKRIRSEIAEENAERIDENAQIRSEIAEGDALRDTAIAEEAETRSSEDAELQRAITTEVLARENADNELSERLDTETSERERLDAEHTERLNNLEETVSENQAKLTAEEHIRRETDETVSEALKELGEGLITEIISRVNDNQRIRSEIAGENAERIAEDTRLQEEIEISSRHSQERDDEILRVIDEVSEEVKQNSQNINEGDKKLDAEINERNLQNVRLLEQIEESERYSLIETRETRDKESVIQRQIDELSEACINQMLEQQKMRQAFREWIRAANVLYEMAAETGNLTYRGARIAPSNEITAMLSDVLSGVDTSEVTESEIPEELRDQVATSEEITEILSEVFSH